MPLIKLLSVILLLIILIKMKADISLSLFIISVYSILIFGVNLSLAFKTTLVKLSESSSIQLYLIVISVLFISKIQQKQGMFDKLINSLNFILRDKLRVSMVGPALIGFLPMPGGALVSAPLVKSSTKELGLKKEFMTFLNYWFRHIWEFVWPIYAGLLLFQTMSKIPMKKIVLLQSPYTLINILSGIFMISLYLKRNGIKRTKITQKRNTKKIISDFIEGTWPVIFIILLFFLFSVPLYLSLVITAVVLAIISKTGWKNILKMLTSWSIIKTLILIASVLVFQNIISVSELLSYLKGESLSLGILVLFSFVISFSLGFLTGVNTAFIAIAFPVMLPVINTSPHFLALSIYLYVIGFAGILLSPVHLCLVLSNEYFGSKLTGVYRYLFPPVLLLMIAATAVVFVLG